MLGSVLQVERDGGLVIVTLNRPESKNALSHQLRDEVTRARLGEFGSASIVVQKKDAALTVPLSAIRGALADGATVVICQGDKAALRKVMLGERDDAVVEIAAGLEASEAVAVDHVLGLDNGTPLKAQ